VARITDSLAIRQILDHRDRSPPEKPPPETRDVVRVPLDEEERSSFSRADLDGLFRHVLREAPMMNRYCTPPVPSNPEPTGIARRHRIASLILAAALTGVPGRGEERDLASYVDPRIGVRDGATSACVIGPQMPFGSVNPSPDTPGGEDDGYQPGEPVRGFSQLHVTGTGWGKYGQILVSPQMGLAVGETAHDSPIRDEVATAYSYAATLERYGIRAELTPTAHAVLYRFTFPASPDASLLLDIGHNIPMDIAPVIGGAITGGRVAVSGGDRVQGWGQYKGGFADGVYDVYFSATLSKPAAGVGTWRNDDVLDGSRARSVVRQDDRVGAYFRYRTSPGEVVLMRIGISMKSIEQAERYASAEIPDWDFEALRARGASRWNAELGRIVLEGVSDLQKQLFYTALYHAMLMPRDRSGDNPAWTSDAPYWDDQYAVWDTWRTLFPLMAIIKESVVRDNVNAFVDRFAHNGVARDGFSAGLEMEDQQGGDDVDNVIADAFAKGVSGVDWERAYALLEHNAEHERMATPREYHDPDNTRPNGYPRDTYRRSGWLPAGIMSCSLTLEFAYNDFCASHVARGLGRLDDSERFRARSKRWEVLWNPEAESDGFFGFVAPKRQDGSWVPFDVKKRYRSWKDYFYEGSAWTYSFFVPHDLGRLVDLMGGPAAFAHRLEHALEHDLIDATNEPGFLAIHTFDYARRPDRAAYWVRRSLERFTLRGYPGNDDSGAMSSWYVFASLGFFPNAGQDVYLIGSPAFPKAVLRMENGRALVVEAHGASAANPFVQSCTLNGRPLTSPWFRHADIREGGTLSFVMGPEPSDWGRAGPPPPSLSVR
jgi:predicted alpha-1,2-mannosidase